MKIFCVLSVCGHVRDFARRVPRWSAVSGGRTASESRFQFFFKVPMFWCPVSVGGNLGSMRRSFSGQSRPRFYSLILRIVCGRRRRRGIQQVHWLLFRCRRRRLDRERAKGGQVGCRWMAVRNYIPHIPTRGRRVSLIKSTFASPLHRSRQNTNTPLLGAIFLDCTPTKPSVWRMGRWSAKRRFSYIKRNLWRHRKLGCSGVFWQGIVVA